MLCDCDAALPVAMPGAFGKKLVLEEVAEGDVEGEPDEAEYAETDEGVPADWRVTSMVRAGLARGGETCEGAVGA